MPPYQAGQRCRCPRCGAEMTAPERTTSEAPQTDGQTTASKSPTGTKPSSVSTAGRSAPVPSSAATAPPAFSPAAPAPAAPTKPRESYDDVYGITCQVCQARLHVRPPQVGTTIQCPDCYSPVVVSPPPKRKTPTQLTKAAPSAESPVGGPTAMQTAAQKMLDKARAELEKEEADQRERSPDRFIEGYFDFLADPRAIVRMVILSVWFALAMLLLHAVLEMQISEDAPAILSEAASLMIALLAGLLLLTFSIAAAAFAWALVKDTSEGLRRIEHWPGVNFLAWDRDLRFIISAGLVAALPGVLVGIVLGLVGLTGTVVYTAAFTFGVLFPPVLLSMNVTRSALAPFSDDGWSCIAQHPEPWKLTYLMTSVMIIVALFGFVTSLLHGFPLGSAGAALVIVCMTLYFRTLGRLFCHIAQV